MIERKLKEHHGGGVTSDWSLFPYKQLAVNAFSTCYSHLILFPLLTPGFQNNTAIKFEYPHQDYETFTKLFKNRSIVQSFLGGLPPDLRQWHNFQDLIIDIIAFLCSLLSPRLKLMHLLETSERKKVNQLVQLHVAYSLNYKLVYSNGDLKILLEPEIDSLIEFPTSSSSFHTDRGGVKFGGINENIKKLREILVNEVKFAKMRQNEIPKSTNNSGNNNGESTFSSSLSSMKNNNKIPQPLSTTDTKSSSTSPATLTSKKINFFFNEGHNNGIKRHAKFKDFQ